MTEEVPADTSQKPEETFRVGPVHASIFKQTGSNGEFRVASIRRRYKDKQGEFQSSHNFTASQLESLIVVATEALLHMRKSEPEAQVAKQPEEAVQAA